MPAILQRFADHATALGTDLRGVFGIDELARSFVQIVCALMTDLAMSLSQRLDRFVSTMTSTLLVRQGRLQLFQLLFHFAIVTWIVYVFPSGECSEVGDPKINAHILITHW